MCTPSVQVQPVATDRCVTVPSATGSPQLVQLAALLFQRGPKPDQFLFCDVLLLFSLCEAFVLGGQGLGTQGRLRRLRPAPDREQQRVDRWQLGPADARGSITVLGARAARDQN